MSGSYQTTTPCVATRSSKKMFYCCEGHWATLHFLKIRNPNTYDVIAVIDSEEKIIGPQTENMFESNYPIKINLMCDKNRKNIDTEVRIQRSSSCGCAVCHGFNVC